MRRIILLFAMACGSNQSQEAPPQPDPAPAEAEAPAPTPETPRAVEAAEVEVPVLEALGLPTWRRLTNEYVTEDGGFRYAALHANADDRAGLAEFVRAIGSASPAAWGRDTQLAFYINAYNALTVNAVIERWPLQSVMDVEGFFDGVEHQVAGESRTLNGLEGDVIRAEQFAEPRIHFAVNCASTGCPPLSREPFTDDNLEAQLQALTTAFLRSTTRLQGRRLHVTKLFEWYADDFGGEDGVRTFLAGFLEGEAAEAAANARVRLVYDDYDWSINARE